MSITTFARAPDYIQLPRDPQPWVVQDLIPIGGLVNLYASPKVGKSFVALGLAFSIADENIKSSLGFPVMKHGPVAYLQLDTPRSFHLSRIEKILKTSPKLNASNLHIADRLMAPKGFTISNIECQHWLSGELERIQPICTIIDTLREFHDQDEDSATAMKKVISLTTEVVGDGAIIFISHSRKSFQNMSEDMGNIMDDARGSGYISGRMDCIAKMTKKVFAYQSRAGKGEFAIQQRPATGEIRRLFSEKSLKDFIKALRERNPEMPMELHLDIILETTDISRELAVLKYNEVLKEREEPESKSESEDLKRALKSLQKLEERDE